jgi:hypothetical protein
MIEIYDILILAKITVFSDIMINGFVQEIIFVLANYTLVFLPIIIDTPVV